MICVPIKRKTTKSVLIHLKEAQKVADLTEIWFDEIIDLTEEKLKEIFKAKKKPIIYKSRGNANLKILEQGINYIDLDVSINTKDIEKIKKGWPKTKIIISFHNFEKTPKSAELKKIGKKMIHKGAEILKIATYAKTFEDSLRMLEFLNETTKNGQKAICLCMGKEGEITRKAGHVLGNYLMFAPIKKTDKTADGQIEVKELKKIMTQ